MMIYLRTLSFTIINKSRSSSSSKIAKLSIANFKDQRIRPPQPFNYIPKKSMSLKNYLRKKFKLLKKYSDKI